MRHIDFYTDQFGSGVALSEGAARYAHLHGPWELRLHQIAARSTDRAILGSIADGIILKNPPPRLIPYLQQVGRPVVQVHGEWVDPVCPRYAVHNHQVGRLGATHLRERAYQRLAFFGVDLWWSNERWAGFSGAVRHLAVTTNQRPDGSFPQWKTLVDEHAVSRFLATLKPPVGVLACNDDAAAKLIEVARRLKLDVPGDVAVLGVNNDPLTCLYGPVQISSIDTDLNALGYAAAAGLDRLMRGERVSAEPPRVPPRGVVQRRSTSALAIDDADLAAAVWLIRERACEGIGVADVVRHVNLSRRTLERRFKAVFGHLPGDELRNHRLRRARDLLQDTHLSLTDVAHRAGFFDSAHFCREFKKAFDQTPMQFRRGPGTPATT